MKPLNVLISNDDGPPSLTESPFILPFIEHLESLGWTVKVCLPDSQKSWISKSYMILDHVQQSYYNRKTGEISLQQQDPADFVLLSGTPATCVNIALNHIFKDEHFDLIIAGPNCGRNTSSASVLSSGTVGAALEAAMSDRNAVALSFAFYSRSFTKDKIDCACQMASTVIRQLWENKAWESKDMFNINVPVVNEIRPVYVTQFHHTNYGSLFKPLSASGTAAKAVSKADKTQQLAYKFSPDFKALTKSEKALPGTDTWAVANKFVSVTPMVASYQLSGTTNTFGFEIANKL